ncbi:uncharacterized protein LOC130054241 [Ostrea edulis]|uniref:uncharacterized protein LOC130054241 n=1 Tax=Ostrea edulis TaxID=37623 RepID=UPI0024AF2258|nr:uncharacterized protein LOC130054241 [Ostrea edulis]
MAMETAISGLLQDCKIKTKLKNADVTGKLDYMNAGYETDIHDLTPGNVQSMINSISLLENNLSSFALQLNSYISCIRVPRPTPRGRPHLSLRHACWFDDSGILIGQFQI